MEKIKEIKNWLEEYKRILLTIIIFNLLLFFFSFLGSKGEKESIEEIDEFFLEADMENEDVIDQLDEEELSAPLEIAIDVKGEVQNPGVYFMDEGKRVIDVIEQAGGVLKDAETTVVNFAELLTDQMVVYIPKIGEELPLIGISDEEETTESLASGVININAAEKSELMTLSGIGEVKAENIISYREENGNFSTIEDLKNVSGIGEKTFENLEDEITVTP